MVRPVDTKERCLPAAEWPCAAALASAEACSRFIMAAACTRQQHQCLSLLVAGWDVAGSSSMQCNSSHGVANVTKITMAVHRYPGPVMFAVHLPDRLQLPLPGCRTLTLSWGSSTKASCRASAMPGQGCRRLLQAPMTACCTSLLLCTWSAAATAVAHMTSCSAPACSLVETCMCSTSTLAHPPVLQSLAALPKGNECEWYTQAYMTCHTIQQYFTLVKQSAYPGSRVIYTSPYCTI